MYRSRSDRCIMHQHESALWERYETKTWFLLAIIFTMIIEAVANTEINMKEYSHSQISAISRLFSSSVVRELARRGRSPLFARLAREVLAESEQDAQHRVYNFFEAAFNVLKKAECRHEYVYKAALTQRILLGKHSLQTASMLNEFRVGDCKADLAILNGTATVYEIKSERDSLSRLERQIETYKGFFATVYVIAGDKHIDSIRSLVSSDVGVLKLSARHQISTLREAKENASRTAPSTIFNSIRVEEVKRILDLMDLPIPDVPNIELREALREQFMKLTPLEAHKAMVQVLKETRNLLPLSSLVERLPNSLHSAALSVPMHRTDHDRLLTAINTPLKSALQWG